MFEASEALQQIKKKKKIKSTSFHQYSWNSEEETTWISLIGWHHKTFTIYQSILCMQQGASVTQLSKIKLQSI